MVTLLRLGRLGKPSKYVSVMELRRERQVEKKGGELRLVPLVLVSHVNSSMTWSKRAIYFRSSLGVDEARTRRPSSHKVH